MKKNKLKEYYGTQRPSFAGGPGAGSNFYSGRDLGTHTKGSLGTRGADSNFSRRMQALVPNDYYELEEEEEFDEDIVVENSRYSLIEALNLVEQVMDIDPDREELNMAVDQILADPTELSRFEASMGERVYEFGSEFLLSTASDALGTFGDEAIGILRIIFNIFVQLRRANNEFEDQEEVVEKYLEYLASNVDRLSSDEEMRNKEIQVMQEHLEKLQELQERLSRDVVDTIQATISLFPDSDPLSMSAEAVATALPEFLPKLLQKFEIDSLSELEMIVKKDPEFKVLRFTIAILSAMKFMSNFAALSPPLIVLSFLNINIFNPAKILISSVHNLFKISQLQNTLLVRIQVLKANRPEYFVDEEDEEIEYSDNLDASDIDSDSPSRTSDRLSKAGTFLRKLFVSKPGDTALFAESLNNRSLAYLIEEKDPVLDEDLEEELAEIEEFSGAGAVAIGTLPLGRSTKGPGNQRSSNGGGKSFPYSRKNRKDFNRYSKRTFGGSDE